MALIEKLKEQGWYLTEEGLKKLTTINNSQEDDVKKIISLALNWDFKDIAVGALPPKPDGNGTIPGRIVLQIQKIRNISAPKANEESSTAPRFLQLELSDGVNTISALEFERIANLNLNVAPGTKLFIKSENLKLLNGFIVLKASDIQLLGGKVEPLVEKWELARQMLKYARSNRRLSGSGGPPPWIAFGKRLDVHKDLLPTDKNFKSLQNANEKDKNSKENDEFNASRIQAIAEAAKAGQKKVFGGGQQNILDHNVKKILEKGYSEEEAKLALKTTNNNLERALYNLKRRNNRCGSSENILKSLPASAGRTRDKGVLASSKEVAAAAKPQTNVSLFDYLTSKLPTTISSSNNAQVESVISNPASDRNSKGSNSTTGYNNKASNSGYNRFENNMSSSFAANRATASTSSEDKQNIQSLSNSFNRKQDENQHSGNKNGKVLERNMSNRTNNQAPDYKKFKNLPVNNDNINSIDSNNSKRNETAFKKEREHTNKPSNSDYQANKRPNDYKINEKKSYQTRDVNRNQEARSNSNTYHHQKQSQKSNNFEKALDNLVDSASKLAIENKKVCASTQQIKDRNHHVCSDGRNNQKNAGGQLQKLDHYPNNSKNAPKFTDSHNISSKSVHQKAKLETYGPQLGNGFAYDPSKIMGFQSKEANEYAMNMLKSQGMTMQQQHTASPQAAPLPLQAPLHHQTEALNQPTNVAYVAHNPNIFIASPKQTPSQFGMMPGENWPWKEGDLCLAKYWDDGNYYNAKITAISEKTCVVLFVEYGNYEEVLKSDCVPVTDTQHIPLNAYQTNINISSISSQPPLSAVQQKSQLHSGIGNIGSQRYRGERQMYIPPPKRNNN